MIDARRLRRLVLAHIDTLTDHSADEIRDFAATAARYIDEGQPIEAWRTNPVLAPFVDANP